MTPTSHLDDLRHLNRGNDVISNSLHHSQMLQVVVCLKESISSEEFHQNATYAPYIARIAPAKSKYDLWSPVMSC